jgi:hypothetical protein
MRWKISGWQGDETRGVNMAGVIGSNIIVWDVEKIVVVIVSFVMLVADRLRHIMYFEIL